MKNFRWLWLVLSLCYWTAASGQAASPTFGNVTVIQNDNGNTAASVTATLSYSQAALSVDGVTSLGNIRMRSASNRGDFNMQFTNTPANDRSLGIMITNVAQLARDNSAGGDPVGAIFATSATETSAGGYYIPVSAAPGGGEFNANLAVSWFPYADGWIGGHAVATTNGGLLTSMAASPGLTLSTTAAGSNVLYDAGATGVYELNLAGINSQTDGILLVSGGKNEDNYALSRANADGTWTISVRDNGADGAGTEADGLAFVYVPTSSAVTGNTPGVHAMGRLNGNLSRDVTAGNYAMVRTGTGLYRLYAPGISPEQATLLLSVENAGPGADNLWFYEPGTHGWNLEYRDLPGMGLQDNGSGDDTLSFALMASGNTAAIWDAGGADTNWTTAGNWVGDAAPTAGQDVVIGTGTGNVAVNSSESVGMLLINRPTGFTLSSNSPLRLTTGLIVSSLPPASGQIYTISAPIQLEADGFILAQSLGLSLTLRLDVASGNAVTADNKNLTLGGASGMEIRDPVVLGTGTLIKEGGNQVTITSTFSVGGVNIFSGPNTNSNGAFRINGPASYAAFGNNDITLTNQSGGITPLYFDSGAGSGEFANNLILQSSSPNSGARILLDNAAGFNVTMSGIISGGNATSEFIVDNDAAGGQGRLHLTNTANSFTALRVNVNRGALVVYGDGVLGQANNSLYLNTDVTDDSTTSGLHFGANNVTLAASRAVTLNTTTPINTGTYTATVAGVISGAGGLIKGGTGVLELTGTNTYLGITSIREGTLLLNPAGGSATGAGAVTVAGNAVLAGRGDVTGAAAILAGGRISPGISTMTGTLTFLNGLDLQGDSRVVFDLSASGINDRLNVSGGALQTSGSQVFEVLLSYTPIVGDYFDLLDWATLTGSSTLQDRLVLPDISGHGLAWDRSLFDSAGILSVQLVPEPSRFLLLGMGAGLVCLRRRRK